MRYVFPTAAVAIALAVSNSAVGQELERELHVYTVDLWGSPRDGIVVTVNEAKATSKGGVARFTAKLGPDNVLQSIAGDDKKEIALETAARTATVRVNLKDSGKEEEDSFQRELTALIGRRKEIAWNDDKEFELGFVVPLWVKGDVKKLADAVVIGDDVTASPKKLAAATQNGGFRLVQLLQESEPAMPKRVAVAVRFDKSAPGGAIVVAKAEGDDKTWLEEMEQSLPVVRMSDLASIMHGLEVGEHLPADYEPEVTKLNERVQEINCKTQVCLRNEVTGKVLINNSGPHDFDILLNHRPVHIPANTLTTREVEIGDVATEIFGQPNTIHNWNHWQSLEEDQILVINIPDEPQTELQRPSLKAGSINQPGLAKLLLNAVDSQCREGGCLQTDSQPMMRFGFPGRNSAGVW